MTTTYQIKGKPPIELVPVPPPFKSKFNFVGQKPTKPHVCVKNITEQQLKPHDIHCEQGNARWDKKTNTVYCISKNEKIIYECPTNYKYSSQYNKCVYQGGEIKYICKDGYTVQ